MISKLPQKKNIIYTTKPILVLLYMIMPLVSFGQTQPPVPSGDVQQYFCSATSWMNAGFTKQGDTFEELYINGENLSFYEDNNGSPGNLISNPSTFTLVDGATYYVTQTVSGVESDPLTITVNDRECGCFKNPDFETYDGQSDNSDYTIYNQTVDDGYKTCAGSITGLAPVGFSAVDAVANGSAGTIVSAGDDPNVNVKRTNPSTNSKFSFRLNDPTSGLDTSHMEKDFVAGEVISFNYAFVLDNGGGHDPEQQPYVNIAIYDSNGDLFAQRCVITNPSDCILIDGTGAFLYTDWTCLKINTLDIIGGAAKMVVTASDCVLQVHEGYFYMDDFFVGDNESAPCNDPGFGYVAMENITASPGTNSQDCIVDVASVQESCGANIQTSLPFPIDVCGTVKEPISNTNPASIQDLTLDISKNGNLVGSVSNPSINGDQFCFTITESDINIRDAYGKFDISTEVNFTLDCGDPYFIQIADDADIDVCPTANCANMLEACDDTGTGQGTFNLNLASDQIRGSEWSQSDVDITYFETEQDAIDNQDAIPDPRNFQNNQPDYQQIYARLDWHPQGTTTSCYYIVNVELSVYTDPTVDIPSEIIFCGDGAMSVPIIATPSNITELTNVSYTWVKNGNVIPFTGSYYAVKSPGVFEITIEEENCSVTKTVEVKRIDFEVDLGDEDPIQLCGNDDTAILTANIIDGSNPVIDESDLNYLWSTGETSKNIEVSETNVYTVEVDYKGECLQQKSIGVVIATEPDITPLSDFEMCTMDEVEVTATVNNLTEQESEFVWYRDGQVLPGEISSTITVGEEGVYTVEVNEIGYDFCFASEEFTVDYYDNADCVITQGISPDVTIGQNDCLDLKFLSDRTGITNIKLYSRYGRLVFDEDDYVDSFCGQNMDGDALPTGTYYYVLVLDAEDPIFEKVIKGWIYINREAN